jgi:hypothetical protein
VARTGSWPARNASSCSRAGWRRSLSAGGDILRLRFEDDLTQREIGERLGISQVKVSRLMRRSLDRVQAMAAADEERSLRAV